MELSILCFMGLLVNYFYKMFFLSLKIVFNLANSADPDEIMAYSSGSALFAKVPVYWYQE